MSNPLLEKVRQEGVESLRYVLWWTSLTTEELERLWSLILRAYLQEYLLPLAGVEMAVAEDDRIGFRLTDVGRYILGLTDDFSCCPHKAAGGEIVVQPNFEIVFLSPSPLGEATLARFAERLPTAARGGRGSVRCSKSRGPPSTPRRLPGPPPIRCWRRCRCFRQTPPGQRPARGRRLVRPMPFGGNEARGPDLLSGRRHGGPRRLGQRPEGTTAHGYDRGTAEPEGSSRVGQEAEGGWHFHSTQREGSQSGYTWTGLNLGVRHFKLQSSRKRERQHGSAYVGED